MHRPGAELRDMVQLTAATAGVAGVLGAKMLRKLSRWCFRHAGMWHCMIQWRALAARLKMYGAEH